MTVTTSPTDSHGWTEAEVIALVRSLGRSGVLLTPETTFDLNRLGVSFGTGMQLLVASGRAIIAGRLFTSDAQQGLTVTNAHVSFGRYDLVVARVDHTTSDTGSIAIITGTPSGSPASPVATVDASVSELALARLLVPAGISSASSGTLTELRCWHRGTNNPGFYFAPPGGGPTISAPATHTGMAGVVNMPIVSDGGDIRVTFSGTFRMTSTGEMELGINLDGGTVVAKGTFTGTDKVLLSFVHRFQLVSVGQHLITISNKVTGAGNAEAYADRTVDIEIV